MFVPTLAAAQNATLGTEQGGGAPQPREELDRSKREAEEARVRALQSNSAPIAGAFSGSTSERDR